MILHRRVFLCNERGVREILCFGWANWKFDQRPQPNSFARLKTDGAAHHFEQAASDDYAQLIQVGFSGYRRVFRVENPRNIRDRFSFIVNGDKQVWMLKLEISSDGASFPAPADGPGQKSVKDLA